MSLDTAGNLRKVLAVNSKMNSTLQLEELLGIIMDTACEVMEAETASLMLLDEGGEELIFKVALGDKGQELIEKFRVKVGEGIAGHVAKTGESLIVNDTRNDPRFASRIDKSTGFESKAIICVPLKSKDRIIGILEAINPLKKDGFQEEDVELFQIFSDQAAVSIENARMHAQLVKQEKARQALKIAHDIQQNLLPDLKRYKGKLDIAARNIPAQDVGGDFFDVISLDECRTAVVIGDVSGKGVPAALFMVRALSEYRNLAGLDMPAGNLMTELNRLLAGETTHGMFVTLLHLIIDINTNTVSYASAGHHPILARRSASANLEELKDVGGLPLAMSADSAYETHEERLQEDDVLLLYTDGVTEARDRSGKEYELEQVKEVLKNRRDSSQSYLEDLIRSLVTFMKGTDQHDDLTAILCRIKPKSL